MRRWPMMMAGTAAALLATVAVARAQHHQDQPYAGQQTRAIKALSEQQVSDLRTGRGMGLALAAELNGYPGPIHVLEHVEALGLSDTQRMTIESLVAAMKHETIPLGQQLIAAEAELDQKFADKSISGDSLAAAVRAIGEASASLRTAHLRYHLATVEVLTPAQVAAYNALRGYTTSKHERRH